MSNRRPSSVTKTGPVDQFIGSAYDVVKGVHDALPQIIDVSANLPLLEEIGDSLKDPDGLGGIVDNLPEILDADENAAKALQSANDATAQADRAEIEANRAHLEADRAEQAADDIDGSLVQIETNRLNIVSLTTLTDSHTLSLADHETRISANATESALIRAIEVGVGTNNGLKNGGDLSANRPLAVDIDGTQFKTSVAATDKVLIEDGSGLKSVDVQSLVNAGTRYEIRGTVTIDAGANTATLHDTLTLGFGDVLIDENGFVVADPGIPDGAVYLADAAALNNSITGTPEDWSRGDPMLYVSSAANPWGRIDDGVETFNGRAGVVVPEKADYATWFPSHDDDETISGNWTHTGEVVVVDAVNLHNPVTKNQWDNKNTTQDGAIADNTTEIGTLKGRVDGHDTTLVTLDSRVTTVESDLATLDGEAVKITGDQAVAGVKTHTDGMMFSQGKYVTFGAPTTDGSTSLFTNATTGVLDIGSWLGSTYSPILRINPTAKSGEFLGKVSSAIAASADEDLIRKGEHDSDITGLTVITTGLRTDVDANTSGITALTTRVGTNESDISDILDGTQSVGDAGTIDGIDSLAIVQTTGDQSIAGEKVFTGKVKVPNTSATDGSAGLIQFNPLTSEFEGHNGTDWGSLGGSGGAVLPPFQVKTGDYLVKENDRILGDTTLSGLTFTLPSSPVAGMTCTIGDFLGTASLINPIVITTTDRIHGKVEDLYITSGNSVIVLNYINNTFGWKIVDGIGEGADGSIARVVETGRTATAWYRKWSDGFIEQGGVFASGGSTTGELTFPIPFTETTYSFIPSVSANGTGASAISVRELEYNNRTNTKVGWQGRDSNVTSGDPHNVCWTASGY